MNSEKIGKSLNQADLSLGEGAIDKINEARILMKDTVENPMSVEKVASHLGVGYSWFRRMFKEYTGISPAQYTAFQNWYVLGLIIHPLVDIHWIKER